MNRRNFLSSLAKGIGLFTILPPSTTYSRIWKAQKPELIVNPDWVNAEWEMEYKFAMLPGNRRNDIPILFKREDFRILDLPVSPAIFPLQAGEVIKEYVIG